MTQDPHFKEILTVEDFKATMLMDFYIREGYRHSSNYMYKIIVKGIV